MTTDWQVQAEAAGITELAGDDERYDTFMAALEPYGAVVSGGGARPGGWGVVMTVQAGTPMLAAIVADHALHTAATGAGLPADWVMVRLSVLRGDIAYTERRSRDP